MGDGMDEKTKCQAAANIAGEHVPCEEPAPHDGLAHSNREHEMIWRGAGEAVSNSNRRSAVSS